MPRPLAVFAEIFADALMDFLAADNLVGVPAVEDVVHDFFDVIEIGFGLERIVDPVVAGLKSSLSSIFFSS